MEKLLKGILEKLFNSSKNPAKIQNIGHAEVEAIVDAKIKEHQATIQSTKPIQASNKPPANQDDNTLTAKQIDYALALLDKVKNEFILAIDPAKLTLKDLNRLAYQRYKNKGTLINLVKKGVLKKK